MKIKTDFITNSSSTIYIVIFPEKKPKVTVQHIAEAIFENMSKSMWNHKTVPRLVDFYKIEIENKLEEMFDEYNNVYIEDFNDEVYKNAPDNLKEYLCDYPDPFSTLLEYLVRTELLLDSIALNGEGNNLICVVDRERVKTVLNYENKT